MKVLNIKGLFWDGVFPRACSPLKTTFLSGKLDPRLPAFKKKKKGYQALLLHGFEFLILLK